MRRIAPVIRSTDAGIAPLGSIGAAAQGPVNLFRVDDYHKQANAGDSITFEWVVFNNNSAHFMVKPLVTPSESHDVEEAINDRF